MDYTKPLPFDNALWSYEGKWEYKDTYLYKKEGTNQKLVADDKRKPILRFEFNEPKRLNGHKL